MTFTCSFDSDWDGLAKHVIFTNGAVSKSVDLAAEGTRYIPHEVLKKGKLYASFIGLSSGGEKKLTTKKMLFPLTVLEAGVQDGGDPEEYSPALWEQALSSIGDLSSLTTDSKSSIVAAVNELAEGGKTVTGFTYSTRTASGNLYGDANGDGYADNRDIIMISLHVNDTGVAIDLEAADLDLDGKVTEDDVAVLERLVVSGLGTSFMLAKLVLTYNDGTRSAIFGRVPVESGGGDIGGYYTPSVDASGNLTWTASKTGMASVPSANIRGPQGAAGRTPVKGTDYFTAAEIASIEQGAAANVSIPENLSSFNNDTGFISTDDNAELLQMTQTGNTLQTVNTFTEIYQLALGAKKMYFAAMNSAYSVTLYTISDVNMASGQICIFTVNDSGLKYCKLTTDENTGKMSGTVTTVSLNN